MTKAQNPQVRNQQAATAPTADTLVEGTVAAEVAAGLSSIDPVVEITWKLGQKANLISLHGPMTHLFTNVVFDQRPVRATIDQFISDQLVTKKLAIVTDED